MDTVELAHDLAPLLDPGGDWDALLSRSTANTLFLTSGWLRAARQTLAADGEVLVPHVWRGGRLVAAGAFHARDGVVEFLGTGPGDYLDLLFDPALGEHERLQLTHALLARVIDAVPRFRCFRLRRLVSGEGTPERLRCLAPFHTAPLDTIRAPSMEMHAAEAALKKQSLRRKVNKLKRAGDLRTAHFTTAEAIRPRLPELFRLHRARWEAHSQFHDPAQVRFFERAVEELGDSGFLRLTEVRLDDALIATHLGFCHAGRFTWYKPAFDPEFSKYSPGLVLLVRLLERALEEGAEELDFTIGREDFKLRFATLEREVVDLYVTDSWVRKVAVESRMQAREAVKTWMDDRGWWAPLRRVVAGG